MNPPHLAEGGEHAELALVLALLAHRRHPSCRDEGAVVGVDSTLPSVSERLFDRNASAKAFGMDTRRITRGML